MSELVWYAAYGSTLSAERFATYLTGGSAPHRTTDQPQAGARDATAPVAGRSWEIPHRLFFAAESADWGDGAVAFLDPSAEFGQRTFVRLWLITAQQFEDVFRQGNGLHVPESGAGPASPGPASPQPASPEPASPGPASPGPASPGPASPGPASALFDLGDLRPGDHTDVSDRMHGRLLHLGLGPDGHPIATFTGADVDRHRLGAAHLCYLRTMGIGLMERFRLKPGGAAKYLAERDGNLGHVDRKALTADLAQWVPSS